ncbi:MAG: acyltransferase family protein [Pirellulales bacterium]
MSSILVSVPPVPSEPKPEPVASSAAGERLVSLDAYRGLAMLAMASGGLALHRVAQNFPESRFWQTVGYQFEHVEWVGCSAWDMIQPSFTFMVGAAMAYSCASRAAHGQSWWRMLRHAVVRSIILVLLGVFLRSDGRTQTNWTFEDVLAQIGLGYTFLFLLWGRSPRVQWAAAIAILIGYWFFFAQYPLPGQGFDYSSVGVPAEWQHQTGLAAHWDKNTNAAAAFDAWFLNQFPREKPFVYNGGGYLTLSFIPSLATMIFGLLAGELLRSPRSRDAKFVFLVVAGLAGVAAGLALHYAGICPIVKRIWTPSWTLASAGGCALILAGLYAVIDVLGFRKWAFPLVVVGMNSITMYVMAGLIKGWVFESLRTHFGAGLFEIVAEPYRPLLASALVLLCLWLVCYWLYRQRIFIRI